MEDPHILAAKWMIKSRLSHIMSMTETSSLKTTFSAIVRLLNDLEAIVYPQKEIE